MMSLLPRSILGHVPTSDLHVLKRLVLLRLRNVSSHKPAASSAGWQHHPATAEDRQEGNPRGGVEQDPCGPKSHSGSPSAARRQGQHSSAGGEAHLLFALRQLSTNTTCPAKEREEKPLRNHCLQVSLGGKKSSKSAHLVAMMLGKKQLLWDCV